MSSPPLLHTVLEVAELLRCHRAQVFRLIKTGKLQTAPRVGKNTLVLRDSLLAFIASNAPTVRTRRARAASLGDLAGLDDLRI